MIIYKYRGDITNEFVKKTLLSYIVDINQDNLQNCKHLQILKSKGTSIAHQSIQSITFFFSELEAMLSVYEISHLYSLRNMAQRQ